MVTAPALSASGPDCCRLRHKVFNSMGQVSFRRSASDGMPMLAMFLGEREVLVSLRSLQREFGIADESEDGRMLGKIVEALDFVNALQIGDRLPAEVLTGDASWEPDPVYARIAAARLRMQLVHWVNGRTSDALLELTEETLQQIEDDPALRHQVQHGVGRAAEVLGLPDAEALLADLGDLARELGYIESLRDRLLRRVQRMAAKVERLDRVRRSDSARAETVTQIARLTAIALKQMAERFGDLDAQTTDVIAALRDSESLRTFIRSNRDWLYRSQRAWAPLLIEWDDVDTAQEEGLGGLLTRTYQFLAPRFMPVTEWLMATRQRRKPVPKGQRMVW
ncbi:MAG: hypothetical protein JSR21_04980 [Proteobacteria bacterium]|nr:hypothetical protein [Pseudomonadota bacterium]